MKIGIDCRTIFNPGRGEAAGVGSYTLHLVEHVLRIDHDNDYTLFLDASFPKEAVRQLLSGRSRVTIVRLPSTKLRRFFPGIYSELLVSKAFSQARLDVLHVPGGRIPASYRGATVLTVHDLAIFRHPEWFPKQTLSTRVLYPKTIAQASQIIAVSNATRHDLESLFAVPHHAVSVIPEGVHAPELSIDPIADRHDLARFFHIHGSYILFVGTIEPRKNISTIINAFDLLVTQGSLFKDLTLVLAGGIGWHTNEILYLLKEKNEQYKKKYGKELIRLLGYVSESAKWMLLRNARVFVFPSLYEGFGLPVLEAMAVGTPTITSKVSSLPEVAGDAAIMIDPNSSSALEGALRRILLDNHLAQELSKNGIEQAARFSWEKTARATRELYEITAALE